MAVAAPLAHAPLHASDRRVSHTSHTHHPPHPPPPSPQVSGAAARALQASSTAASQALQMSRRALEHQAVASGVRTVNDTVKRGWGFLSSAMSSVLGQVRGGVVARDACR